MKALVLGFVLATYMGSALAAKPAKKDLVLIGMVTGIDPLVEEFGVDHFMITVAVTKVVSGDLHEPTFKFPIHSVARSRLEFGGTYEIRARHSPAQAGLKVGKTYTIPARWTGDGYEVDELDVWRRNAH
jgi:hypothetical protein